MCADSGGWAIAGEVHKACNTDPRSCARPCQVQKAFGGWKARINTASEEQDNEMANG